MYIAKTLIVYYRFWVGPFLVVGFHATGIVQEGGANFRSDPQVYLNMHNLGYPYLWGVHVFNLHDANQTPVLAKQTLPQGMDLVKFTSDIVVLPDCTYQRTSKYAHSTIPK